MMPERAVRRSCSTAAVARSDGGAMAERWPPFCEHAGGLTQNAGVESGELRSGPNFLATSCRHSTSQGTKLRRALNFVAAGAPPSFSPPP